MLSSLKVLFLGKPFWGFPSPEGSQILSKQLFHKQLPTLKFQLSMLNSSKILFWGLFGGRSLPRGTPNLVKIIVSPTTFYIVSFNFLCQAIQNGLFLAHIFGGSRLTWNLIKTICK